MGLDSYLYKKTHTERYNPKNKKMENFDIDVIYNGKPVDHIKSDRVSYIAEEVGYWRKADHIHKWFVDNVQEGVDNCASYYVSNKDLEKLLDVCKKVVEDPSLAEELLPTTQGFFFEDYTIEDRFSLETLFKSPYMLDIVYTIDLLEELFEEDDPYIYYEYQSSW